MLRVSDGQRSPGSRADHKLKTQLTRYSGNEGNCAIGILAAGDLAFLLSKIKDCGNSGHADGDLPERCIRVVFGELGTLVRIGRDRHQLALGNQVGIEALCVGIEQRLRLRMSIEEKLEQLAPDAVAKQREAKGLKCCPLFLAPPSRLNPEMEQQKVVVFSRERKQRRRSPLTPSTALLRWKRNLGFT